VLLRRTELALAVLFGGFAGLAGWHGTGLGAVLALTVVTGSARAMHQVVRGAFVYDLAGGTGVVKGLGRVNLGGRIGQLLGASAAGAALRHGGPAAAFGLLAAVHLVGAAAFARLSRPPARPLATTFP
jgi:hypothetical protein